MSKLQQFKQQNPDYANVPDNVLADALYKKYYSNIPRDEFENKLGIKQINQTNQQVQPRRGEGFFEENIARPALRATKSIAASGAGLADIANMAAELPLYLGNRAYQYGKQALTGEEIQQYQPTFMQNSVAEATRQAFDRGTGGLTANRNAGEQLLEIPQEIAGGFISPVAVAKGAQPIIQGAKELGKKGLQKITGAQQELVKVFEEAGVNPTLADISQGQTTKTFQNLLANFPGSRGVIEKVTQQQADDIAKQIAGITKSPGGTMQEAGKKIQEGAVQFKGLVENRVGKLYDDLDKFIPDKKQSVNIQNLTTLANSPEIQDVAAVGTGDTAKVLNRIPALLDEGGNVSYPRLKIFRTTIGRKLSSPTLMGDERGALKQVYGALSEDMKNAIVANGGEKGLQAFNKANNAFARSQEFLEANINPLIEAQTPEKVYDLALRGAKQGGSRIKPIMTALNPMQKEFVRGTIAKRMGMASPGQQDAAGEIFSPAKFLTEWNKLSPEAKNNIFTKPQVESVNNLNKAISLIKETGKAKQTSNNLPYLNWLGLGGLIGAASATGGIVGGALTGAAVTGGANITAKMMTNPAIVKWLVKAPYVKGSEISNHLKQLSKIAATNSAIREDILEYLSSITISDANAASEKEILDARKEVKKQIPSSYQKEDLEEIDKQTLKRFYKEK